MSGADKDVIYATYCVAIFCPILFAFFPHTHYPLSTYQQSPGLQNALNPTQPWHMSHPHPHCSLHRSRALQTCQTAQTMGMSQSKALQMKIHKTHLCTLSSRLSRSYLLSAFDARHLPCQHPRWQAATAGWAQVQDMLLQVKEQRHTSNICTTTAFLSLQDAICRTRLVSLLCKLGILVTLSYWTQWVSKKVDVGWMKQPIEMRKSTAG